jgi:predicted oxidoreductase
VRELEWEVREERRKAENLVDELKKENDKLREALKFIQTMCGIADASDACHRIMKYSQEVLEGKK